MPSWWRQGCLRINDDKDTIATRATTPAWGRQQCHHNEGNNAVTDQGWWCHCYEGNDASLTTARTPAHWQWQQHHCHEANNCNCNNDKDACTSAAMAPLQQGQWRVTRATTLVWQQWRRLHINDGNDAIMMRVTIAIGTTAKMPAHWQQQCHHDKDNHASLTTSDKGNNASMMTAEMPLH